MGGGIFGHAVTAQIIGMGDQTGGAAYGEGLENYFALGDGTLSPIIARYDHSRARCMGSQKGKGLLATHAFRERYRPRDRPRITDDCKSFGRPTASLRFARP